MAKADSSSRVVRRPRRTRPFPTTLPVFIKRRDRFAQEAGLTIERAWGGYSDRALITRYCGTYEMLTNSRFILSKDMLKVPDSPRHCVKTNVWDPEGPHHKSLVGAFRREDGMFYVKFEDELPETYGTLEGGSEYYTYQGWRGGIDRAVYIGTRKALLADGVATEKQLPKPRIQSVHAADFDGDLKAVSEEAEAGGYTYTIWETSEIEEGRIRHIKHVADAEKIEEAKEAERRGASLFRSPEAFRDEARLDVDLLLHMLRRHQSREQAGSVRYSFDAATVARLEGLIQQIQGVISNAPIGSHPNESRALTLAHVSAREAADSASTDRRFQGFLRLVMPRNQEHD